VTQPFSKLPLTRAEGPNLDIDGWMRSLGLERYEAAFRENEIDEKVLPRLTAEDLKDLGVGRGWRVRKAYRHCTTASQLG